MTVSGLKRFFREYAIALCATVLLIIILVGLLVSRYYALAGLGELSKINPLINFGKNQLVGRDKDVGIIPDQGASDSSNASNTTDTTQKPSQQQSSTGSSSKTSTSSSGQSSGSTSSSGSSSSGTGTGTGTGSPNPPAPPFTVSIGTMTQVASSPSDIVHGLNPVCTITHQFKAAIHAVNGPGTMKYVWVQSNGTTSSLQSKDFTSGTSDDQVTYQWTITATSGSYWIKLSVSSPNQTEQTLNFNHQCVL